MNLKYPFSILFLLYCFSVSAQQTGSVLQGKIKTTANEPAPFVSLFIKHSNLGTVTDEEGSYVIKNIPLGKHTLVVKAVGFNVVEKEIKIEKDTALTVDVTISPSSTELQAVEVTGRKEQTYKNSYAFSGTKTETPLRYVPQAISYVTKEVMLDRQAFKNYQWR
jgi:iron complex outermembrane receptor protein